VTGDLYNYNLQPGAVPIYRFFHVSASTGITNILATVKDPTLSAAYIHSLFLTENYLVLCIPTTHFAWRGLKILWDRQLLSAMKPFDKADLMKWIVVDRRHNKGVVGRFSTPAGFFFHSINAFEEYVYDGDCKQTDICLDYIHYDSTDVVLGLSYDIILDRNGATKKHWIESERYKTTNPRLVRLRYRMPLDQKSSDASAATAEEVLSIPGPHAGEMPIINAAYACKPYRYVYSAGIRGLATFVDSLVKTDLDTRDAVIWCGPRGHSPGEPIFVVRPGATDEDDGIILSLVLDGSAEKSYLMCLDARTMTEVGRAQADFPIAIGLHGIHNPAM
jgi:torulene dioxygenase